MILLKETLPIISVLMQTPAEMLDTGLGGTGPPPLPPQPPPHQSPAKEGSGNERRPLKVPSAVAQRLGVWVGQTKLNQQTFLDAGLSARQDGGCNKDREVLLSVINLPTESFV
ncbi:unnamed protein product [Gulo gulo]|uniref:Uncharacterized protein n=1 Tax=Gulo gulo TaxID=48420 RepID=A0A9X9LFL9_GULGU|nr:unnamed protein product [Gulo gulo]